MLHCLIVNDHAEIMMWTNKAALRESGICREGERAKNPAIFKNVYCFYYYVLNYLWDSDLKLDLMVSIQIEIYNFQLKHILNNAIVAPLLDSFSQ